MGVLARLFKPLVLASKAFFVHDLALRRTDSGMALRLEPRGPGGRKASQRARREDEARLKARAELDLVLTQLQQLLDENPDTRGALRQLVFVEHALRKKGLKALHKLPLPVLQRALAQLEGLVTNWSPQGLANLRSKMAVAIIDREHHNPDQEADAYRTAAVMDPNAATPSRLPSQDGLARGGAPSGADDGSDGLSVSEDEALAAAYASLVDAPPTPAAAIETQGELGSRSARALAKPPPRPTAHAGHIQLRDVEVTSS